MTSIKVSFDKEIRRISLGTEEARGLSSFSTFASTIKGLFPQLANKSISLTYIDDNFEKITVSSDAELQEAIRILRLDGSQNVLRFDVQPVGAQAIRNASVEVVVHHHVTCDECGMNPIRGIRYKCTVRDNFDLCENCEAKRTQPYAMIKITDPQQAPVALVYGMRDGNAPGGCPWRRGGCRRMPQPAAAAAAAAAGPACPAFATNNPGHPASSAVPPAAAAAPSEEIPRWKARWERRSERCGRRLNESVAPFISAFDKMVQDPKAIVSDGPTNVAKAFTDFAQGLSGAMAAALGAEDETAATAAADKTPESQDPATVDPVNASWEDQLMQEAIQESLLLNEVATAFADVDNKNKTVSSVSTATAAAADVSVPATAVSAPLTAPPLQKPALRFIKDVTFPDGTAVRPETAFRKVWRVRNDGPSAWPVDAVLVPAGGDVMGPDDLTEALPVLAAGEEREIGINLTAPSRPGLYTAYFRAQTKEKQFFGHRLWATVLVSEPVAVPVSVPVSAAPVAEEGWTNVETGHSSGNASPAAAAVAPVAGEPVVRVESVDSVDNDAANATATATDNAEVQPLYLLWRKELAILADMGFVDFEVNLPLLQKHLDNTPVSLLGNNAVPKPEGMQRVIAALLGM